MSLPKGAKIVSADFPLKGLNLSPADGAQPKGTTREALNVLPFTGDGRARGGTRPGFTAVSPELPSPITMLMSPVSVRSPTPRYVDLGYAEIDDEFFGPSPGIRNINDAVGDRWTGRAFSAASPFLTGAAWTQTPTTGTVERFTVMLSTQLDGRGNPYPYHKIPPGAGGTGHAWVCHWNDPTDPPPGPYAVRMYVQVSGGGSQPYVFTQADGHDFNSALILEIADADTLRLHRGGTLLGSYFSAGEFSGTGWLEIIVDGAAVTAQWKGKSYLSVTEASNGHAGWGFGGYEFTVSLSAISRVGRWQMKATPAAEGFRRPFVVAVAGGYVFKGDTFNSLEPSQPADPDVPHLRLDRRPQGTWTGTEAFFVDGTSTLVVDLATNSIGPLTATASKGTVPAGCRICCLWRGRLVLANQTDFPQNVYLSRSGDVRDWLYGGQDALNAVALNASSAAGRIGQPVYALIPFRDDNLVIGCDHSLYVLAGDPQSSSGQLVTLSESIGMLGPDAWTQDPEGVVYFVGTGGFYKMSGTTSEPVNVSKNRLNEWFRLLDRSTSYIEVEWDRDRHGCWIFAAPTGGGTGKGLWWDARLDAFFELTLPERFGPVCALVYDGDGPLDRFLWLGGRDGFVRQLDATPGGTDDGDTIVSTVVIGPVQPFGDFDDTQLTRFETVWGTGTTEARLEILAGGDAAAAAAATPSALSTFSAGGRGAPILSRYRANTFYFRVSADAGGIWSMERVRASATYGGQNRG